MKQWTYQDARQAFLRWMTPEVSKIQDPRERIDCIVRHLGWIINLHEDERVRSWAERLWHELLDLDLVRGRA